MRRTLKPISGRERELVLATQLHAKHAMNKENERWADREEYTSDVDKTETEGLKSLSFTVCLINNS